MSRAIIVLHILLLFIKFLLMIFEKKEPQIFDEYQEEFKFVTEF